MKCKSIHQQPIIHRRGTTALPLILILPAICWSAGESRAQQTPPTVIEPFVTFKDRHTYSAVLSPKGDVVLTHVRRVRPSNDPPRRFNVWDTRVGRLRATMIPISYRHAVERALFAPDDTALYVHAGSQILSFGLPSGRPAGVLLGHDQEITAVDISSNGGQLVTACEAGNLLLWDLTEPRPQSRPLALRVARVTSASFVPGQDKLVTAHVDQDKKLAYLALWDTKNHQEIGRFGNEPVSSDRFTAVSATGVLADYENGRLRLWDLGTLKQKKDEPLACRNCFGWSPDGRYVVITDMGSNQRHDVLLLDSATLEEVLRLRGNSKSPSCVQFSSNGETVMAFADHTVQIWNLPK